MIVSKFDENVRNLELKKFRYVETVLSKEKQKNVVKDAKN